MYVSAIKKKLQAKRYRSAWQKGVLSYAIEMLETCGRNDITDAKQAFNHCNYKQMKVSDLADNCSFGGCFEIYDENIAKRLLTPSELKRCYYQDGTFKQSFHGESFLSMQARALIQAHNLIKNVLADFNILKGMLSHNWHK